MSRPQSPPPTPQAGGQDPKTEDDPISKLRERRAAVQGAGPRLPLRDLLAEAGAGLLARPARVMLTVLGTVVGVAALVATLGLSKTASNQIVGRFDAIASTDIVVSPARRGARTAASVLPFRAEDSLQYLHGVVAAGSLSDVNVNGELVSSVPVNDPQGLTRFQLPVKAASPGLWRAVRAKLATGRFPDAGHSATGARIAVLGPTAAERLNISRVDQRPAIYIGDRLYLVVGILKSVQRQQSLLRAVTIPEGTAQREFGLQAPGLAQIETAVGATDLIAKQAPLALSPAHAADLKLAAPPNPKELKGGIQNDLNALFVLLGAVSLLVGAIGIANVTLVSVLERVGEIGLRRALGAGRRHIAAQFLVESSAMGALGGIVGASIGTLVVVGISAMRTWTPVLDPWIPLAAPLLGAFIGLISGTYPAIRASRMEPVDALRAGT
ncbi:MAG TPA: ABC transporter permease [Solirubrobacteraceae bacterium]|jgi:ABC-type antimicrobial peptide transport system permease subunit